MLVMVNLEIILMVKVFHLPIKIAKFSLLRMFILLKVKWDCKKKHKQKVYAAANRPATIQV